MKLLIDIGNSRIKWGITDSDAVLQHSGLLEQDTEAFEALLQRLHGNHPITASTVVCVGRETLYQQLASIVRQVTGVGVTRFISRKNAAGVKNAYRDFQTLGADRWAALIAAYRLYPAPLLVCDCGTALTLDLVESDGAHIGGYILPGLRMARLSLHEGTENLPQTQGGDLISATDSVSAISNGTLLQLVAAIEHVVAEHGQPNCVLTGGDAVFIGSFLGFPFHHDPDLVLKGLAIAEA